MKKENRKRNTEYGKSLRKGLLFVLSAPSGGGKTTVKKHIMKKFPKMFFSVSCATRAKRKTEKDGRDYLFVSREKFLKMRKKGELLEWAKVYGDFYGTPKAPAERAMKQGKSVFLAVDIKGGKSIKKLYGGRAVLIFIAPPSLKELQRRLKKRGDLSSDALKRRLSLAKSEIREAKKYYDYFVINDTLETCLMAVRSIIIAEKRRIRNRQKIWRNI